MLIKNVTLLFLLLLSLSLIGNAATTTITNTCMPPMGTPVTGSANCSTFPSSGGYDPGASASASVSLSIAVNAANDSVFSTKSTVNANGVYSDPSETHWLPALAQSLISFNDTLITAGDPRSGFIQVNVTGSSLYSAGMETGGGVLSLPSAADGTLLSDSCSLYNCPYPPFFIYNTFPFKLGVAFPITYSASLLSDSASAVDGPSSADIQLNYGFRFFEADGVTPVAVSETPEPSGFALLSVSGLGLFYALRRHRNS